jgi:hypothetical protein
MWQGSKLCADAQLEEEKDCEKGEYLSEDKNKKKTLT